MKRSYSLIENVSWRVTLDFISRGSFFIVNVLVARSLGVSEFGKFAYAVSLTQLFYAFTDLGIGFQLVKELGEERGRDEAKWVHYFELKLMLMAVAALLFCACFFVWKWEKPWLLLLALIWMLANSLLDFNQFVCNGLGRVDVAREVLLSQRLCTLAGVIFALWAFPSLTGVLSGLAIGAAVGAVVSNRRAHRMLGIAFGWRGNRSEWGRILKTSLPLGVGSAFGLWYLRIGGVLLAWYWSSEIVGEFSAAFRLFEVTYLFPAAIMSAAIPHLSSALKKGREWFLGDLRKLALSTLAAAAGWGLFLWVGSSHLVGVFYGERYAGAAPLLARIALPAALVFVSYFVTCLMVVFNLQRRHALNEMLAFVVGALLNVALVPTKGAVGAVYALIGTELFRSAITLNSLVRQWRLMAPAAS